MSWVDWTIVVLVWSLIPACFFAKWYRDRRLGRRRRRQAVLAVALPPPSRPELTRADVDEFVRKVTGAGARQS